MTEETNLKIEIIAKRRSCCEYVYIYISVCKCEYEFCGYDADDADVTKHLCT